MKNYYFTFGSDELFPYQNTYLIVEAENKNAAINCFNSQFPCRNDECINCAFVYTEDEWKTTIMAKRGVEPIKVLYDNKSFANLISIKKAIDALKMENELMCFDPNNGEDISLETLKCRNEDNYQLYLANCKAIEILSLHI